MRFFKNFLNFFTTITTVITAVVAVVTPLGDYNEISPFTPLHILGAGAVTALLTAVIYSIDWKSRTHFFVMTVIHYVLLCIVMNVFGIMFHWTGADPLGILLMCLYVAIVYAVVYVITFVLASKEADMINRALNERKKKD